MKILNQRPHKSLNLYGRRYYSTSLSKDAKSLDPYWVTGFCDTESSFNISIQKTDSKLGWYVKPEFTIKLHRKDLALLNQIQVFLGIGTVNARLNNSAVFRVSSIKEIINVIIAHFTKYPLITQKQADYELFKAIL